MENPFIPETAWPLSLQHKAVGATVKESHSPVASASKAFVKDWYTDIKRKEAIKRAENVFVPIVERFNVCAS